MAQELCIFTVLDVMAPPPTRTLRLTSVSLDDDDDPSPSPSPSPSLALEAPTAADALEDDNDAFRFSSSQEEEESRGLLSTTPSPTSSSTSSSGFLQPMADMARLACPVVVEKVISRSAAIMSLAFVGQLASPADLPGAALASTLTNVLGFSILVGLNGALSTFGGQAFGAGNHKALGEALNTNILIAMLSCLPILVVLYNAEPILVNVFGQDADLASSAASFLRFLAPSVVGYAFVISQGSWLTCQRMTMPGMLASAVATLLHPLNNILLIKYAHLGAHGAALATVLIYLIQAGALFFYIAVINKATHNALTVPTFSALRRQVGPFLALALPSLGMLTEWWASESVILMAGHLKPEICEHSNALSSLRLPIACDAATATTALSIYQTTNSVCFMLPLGIAIAVATRVANALGAGKPDEAKTYAKVATVLTFGLGVVNCIVINLGRSVWPRLFVPRNNADDGDTIRLADSFFELESHLLTVLSVYVILDAFAVFGSAVCRGTGRQREGARVVLFSYWAVGVPLGYVLGFVAHMGPYGLVAGMFFGKMIHTSLMMFLVIRTDWKKEAENARKRVGANAPPPACEIDDVELAEVPSSNNK